MGATNKGDRLERQAKKALEANDWKVHKKRDTAHNSGDMFGLFDLVALKRRKRPLFVQVKANTTSGWLKQLRERADALPKDAVYECWIKYDREGWRILRFGEVTGFFEVADTRQSSKNMQKALKHAV